MSDWLSLSPTAAMPREATAVAAPPLPATLPPPSAADASPSGPKQAVIALLDGYSIETTPAQAERIDDFRDLLRPGTQVSVTFLPGHPFERTLETAILLARQGFQPVPHIAARSTPDAATLDGWLARLTAEAGVREVLVIAGGLAKPLGAFGDTMALLETGLFDRRGIERIGVAGHPEGSPDIPAPALAAALAWKRAYGERTGAALHIVTQFCFEAAPIVAWDRALGEAGSRLPIHIGIPGPATLKALINYARLCGIGNSMRVLSRRRGSITKMMSMAAPVRLVADLARYRAEDGDCGIVGAHIYPLGGIRRATQWLDAIAAGGFTMHGDGSGFSLDPDRRI